MICNNHLYLLQCVSINLIINHLYSLHQVQCLNTLQIKRRLPQGDGAATPLSFNKEVCVDDLSARSGAWQCHGVGSHHVRRACYVSCLTKVLVKINHTKCLLFICYLKYIKCTLMNIFETCITQFIHLPYVKCGLNLFSNVYILHTLYFYLCTSYACVQMCIHVHVLCITL